MIQVLVVCPEAPYPALGGGQQRIASLIGYFRERGCAVDVLTFVPFEAPAGALREVLCVPLPANGRSLPARVLRNTGRLLRGVPPLIDRLAGFDSAIRAALGSRRYDIALLEHLWIAPYLDLFREFAGRVWCDLHNVESSFFESLARSSKPPMSWVHARFGRLNAELERQWLPRFDGRLVCSDDDAARIGGGSVVPNTIPWRALPDQTKTASIVFSGNMEYHPNQQAVKWFHQNIWPAVRKAGVKWRLVGMNERAIAPIVAGDPDVEVTGAVEDAFGEIAKSKVAVVPLLSGSGTRVKILEAWAAGTAVVSTTIGAEGLPCNGTLRRADSAEEFAREVLCLLGDDTQRAVLEQAGRSMYEASHHHQAAWAALDAAKIL